MKRAIVLAVIALIASATQAVAVNMTVEIPSGIKKVNDTFDMNVSINPSGMNISGAQANIFFNNSLIRINKIEEGGLFKQEGLKTFFSYNFSNELNYSYNGINNSLGVAYNLFTVILGSYCINSPGNFLIINATVVDSVTNGTAKNVSTEIGLASVLVADPDANAVPFVLNNGTLLLKTLPVLSNITVSPATKLLSIGEKVVALSALCIDQHGAPIACGALNWTSSNTTVATVNATGVVTTNKTTPGIANITANSISSNGNMSLTVEIPTLATIVLSPAEKTVNVSQTFTVSAMCKNQFNAPASCGSLNWTSSNTTVATVNATTKIVVANEKGSAYINATNGSINGASKVTVV